MTEYKRKDYFQRKLKTNLKKRKLKCLRIFFFIWCWMNDIVSLFGDVKRLVPFIQWSWNIYCIHLQMNTLEFNARFSESFSQIINYHYYSLIYSEYYPHFDCYCLNLSAFDLSSHLHVSLMFNNLLRITKRTLYSINLVDCSQSTDHIGGYQWIHSSDATFAFLD